MRCVWAHTLLRTLVEERERKRERERERKRERERERESVCVLCVRERKSFDFEASFYSLRRFHL